MARMTSDATSPPSSMLARLSLASRHALVCGASSGIGRAAALALASLGARVTPLARSRDALEALTPELRANGSPESTHFIVADLDDRASIVPPVEALINEL